jgi:hypothetical protein
MNGRFLRWAEARRIRRPHPEQQVGQEPREAESRDQADRHAGAEQAGAVADHEREDPARGGSERHAHAELAGALGDEIGQQAVQAHRDQRQRHRPERVQQHAPQAALPQRLVSAV